MPRKRLGDEPALDFIPSGSTLLDLVLGGGWAQSRVFNIVGDKSAGKTLLAIEACANFALAHDAADIAYRESEAAFNIAYAQSLGLPKGIDYSDKIRTVQDFERDLGQWLDTHDGPSLYILDSLDALSSEAEMDRATGQASYGDGKAKALSEMFRKINASAHEKQCALGIISQIRDNIGVMFGERYKRSGGHALDFYCAQIIWLHEIKKINREVSKVKRATGVEVLANCKKNKVGMPFRQAAMIVTFGYGVDDEQSMLAWLKANGGESHLSLDTKTMTSEIGKARAGRDRGVLALLQAELKTAVTLRWREIEAALAPPMRKYGG